MKSLTVTGHALLKKRAALLLFGLFALNISAQIENPKNPSQITDLAVVMPPSPTVAGFMKFEEVPVDNYSGIPNTAIPLFSVGTHSKDVGINLSLNYHPSSIVPGEESSYVGLGWSLYGAGTISRTVKGMPDERNDVNKYGIHSGNNPYYGALAAIGTLDPDDILATYLYDTDEVGKFDSEHDLYQFNFMGKSGRFYITNLCGSSPCYQIKRLDNDNAIQITYNGNPANPVFTVFDDKGYKYIFDVPEVTTPVSASNLYRCDGTSKLVADNAFSYMSSLHLSRIYDRNNILLVEFGFSGVGEIIENTPNVTTTTNTIITAQSFDEMAAFIESQCPFVNGCDFLEPETIVSMNNTSTATRKITLIDVKDFAKIYLSTTGDRQDSQNTNAHRLSDIVVKNYRDETIKKIHLEHSYSTIKFAGQTEQSNLKKRLMLSKVHEIYGNDTLSYKFDYVKRPDTLTTLRRDYWGYVTGDPELGYTGTYREANNTYCKIDALQKITLPTGGARIYDWESNTYSYIGEVPLDDFSGNLFNWERTVDTYVGSIPSTTRNLTYSVYDQHVNFNITKSQYGGYSLYKQVNGVWEPVTVGSYYVQGDHILEGGTYYQLRWSGGASPGGPIVGNPDGSGVSSGFCTINYLSRTFPEKKYLYGGGIRISRIGYFDDYRVRALYYESPIEDEFILPVKEKKYTYNFFDDPNRSSGSLVFAKPVYEYPSSKTIQFKCQDPEGGIPTEKYYEVGYDTTTDFNNLNPSKTHGSDVGYQNVQVTETGNGYSRYIYYSPIDFPEESYLFTYPFPPTPNIDYKRGHLVKEMIYDQQGKKLTETKNTYDFIEGEATTGLRIFSAIDCPYRFEPQNLSYIGYKTNIDACGTNNNSQFCWSCTDAPNYISYPLVREAFGWVQLKEKLTTNYFYDESNIPQPVSQKELFTYNNVNKQIASKTTETYSSGTIEKQTVGYAYYPGANNYITDIESVGSTVNGHKFESRIVRTIPLGHIDMLPHDVREWKLGLNTDTNNENNLLVIKQMISKYDIYGNPEVIVTENFGKYTSYIWGYNSTLPIAVIEGGSGLIIIAPALQSLIDEAVAVSNSPIANDYLLRTKLEAIRNYLPSFMVTAYTYKPLVGITSVTDPKGMTTHYEYDAFNRLKNVKDANYKLLSENEYNYQPTN